MSLRISCRVQDEWISADETDWSERVRAEGWLAKGERGRNGQTTASGPGTSKVRVLEGNGARWKNCLDVKTWESLLRRPHSIKRPRPKRYAIHRAAYIYVEEALAQTHGRAAYTERKIYTTTQGSAPSTRTLPFATWWRKQEHEGGKDTWEAKWEGRGKEAVVSTSSRVVSYRNLLPATNPSHPLRPRGTGSIDQ